MTQVFDKITMRIDPKFLSSSLDSYISSEIKKKIIGSCTAKGYVEIINDIVINDIYISKASCDTIASVNVNEIVWKPEIGDELDAKVTTVHKGGVMCKSRNDMGIFLPLSTLAPYVFANGEYVFEKKKIAIDSLVKIKITQIKFEGNFRCIGKLE